MQEARVLDHGFVRCVDVMGGDKAIVDAARLSIAGENAKPVSEDRALIRYLLRHRHTTPFEMVVFKFHCKMPIFVARQWIRHRMASVNEMSARYSELPEEFYVPEPDVIQFQAKKNKQGRAEPVPAAIADRIRYTLRRGAEDAFRLYHLLLGRHERGFDVPDLTRKAEDATILAEGGGVARELARINLPLSTYTEWYWKIDLHNLFGFLGLRMDTHAQYEIRVYAEAIGQMVKEQCPMAWEAFEDFRLNAMTLSAPEIEAFKDLLARCEHLATAPGGGHYTNPDEDFGVDWKTKREREEFIAKLERFKDSSL